VAPSLGVGNLNWLTVGSGRRLVAHSSRTLAFWSVKEQNDHVTVKVMGMLQVYNYWQAVTPRPIFVEKNSLKCPT